MRTALASGMCSCPTVTFTTTGLQTRGTRFASWRCLLRTSLIRLDNTSLLTVRRCGKHLWTRIFFGLEPCVRTSWLRFRPCRNLLRRVAMGFCLEMATGTGKTTVAAAICRLYLQAGVAERILFLVDRDELYRQAVGDLDQALEGQYQVVG